MFGFDIPAIVEGHFKEITNQENALYQERIAICKECPLFGHNALGDVCDAKKCFDTSTNQLVYAPNSTSICGCGCRLSSKLRVKGAHCVLGKF